MKTKILRNPFSQSIGFMFQRKTGTVLIFEFSSERRIGIHTFFMIFPIDVYFMNSKKKIVEVKKNLRPWRFYTSRKKARYMVECATGVKWKKAF